MPCSDSNQRARIGVRKGSIILLGVLAAGVVLLARDAALSITGDLRYPDGSVQDTAPSGVAPVVDSGQTRLAGSW